MSRPTPMTAYRTVTTAAVMRPPVEPKTASRMGAIADLVKAGHSPIDAMIMLERRDHSRKLPDAHPQKSGGKGMTRPRRSTPLHDALAAQMTDQWRVIDPALCAMVNATIDTIRNAMKRLADQGHVECRRVSNSRLEWRVPE